MEDPDQVTNNCNCTLKMRNIPEDQEHLRISALTNPSPLPNLKHAFLPQMQFSLVAMIPGKMWQQELMKTARQQAMGYHQASD